MLLGLLLAASGLSQETYRIAGSVVNSQTGLAVRGALVQVQGTEDVRLDAPNTFLAPAHREILTDQTGRFSAEGLRAGTYRVTSQKNGFTSDRGTDASISIGPAKDGVVVSLTPLGVISGRVVDGDGEAVSYASIRALISEIVDGTRRSRQVRTVSTDDQGRYRLWNLPAGEYYIVTVGRAGGTSAVVGPVTQAGPLEAFAPTYFPSAKERGTATPIVLGVGQDSTADVRVAMEPCFRLRGTLRGAARNQPVTVELLRGEGDLNATRATVNPATGRFEVFEAVPGNYILRATQGTGTGQLRGQQEIKVTKADVNGVVLDLTPGVAVTGVIRRPPQAAQAAPVDQQFRVPRGITARVTLTPFDGLPGLSGYNSTVDEQGRFSFEGVMEGRYRLTASTYDGYISSAMSGTQDVLRGALTVAAGASPPNVEIDVRLDSATIKVKTAEAKGTILVAPTEGGTTQSRGVYGGEIPFVVAPGGYRVFWIKDVGSVEYRNPAVVNALRGGREHSGERRGDRDRRVEGDGAMKVWLALLTCASAWAQTYSISGVVVHPDGRPAKRVRVAVAPSQARENQTSVVTGTSGAFRFDKLPAGKFHLSAETAAGWVQSFGQRSLSQGFGSAVVTGQGQASDGLVFKLTPPAVLHGRVADTNGEAAENVLVQLFASAIMRGKRTVFFVGSRYTDDRGEYRFGNLRDGAFYIAVAGKPWYLDYVRHLPDSPLSRTGYAAIYYPGAADARKASSVQLKPGGEAVADFTVTAQPAGTLTVTPKGLKTGSVRLDVMFEGVAGSQAFARVETANGERAVPIGGVQPGRYTVRARAANGGKGFFGIATVEMGNQDMSVEVAMAEPPPVTGKLMMQDGSPIPADAYIELENEVERMHMRRAVAADGAFEFEALPPGSYRALAGTPNRLLPLRGVTLNGAAVKTDMFEIAGTARLELSASRTGIEVLGEVHRDGKPVEGVLALLAPVKESASITDYRAFQTDNDGSFEWREVPPGDYVLIVKEDWFELEYANPAAVRPLLAGGRPVRVTGGGNQKILVELK
ncbi:MAG: carboxypeptidase-like regulatory domain-containing protein [Candidatus Solibacter sp.]